MRFRIVLLTAGLVGLAGCSRAPEREPPASQAEAPPAPAAEAPRTESPTARAGSPTGRASGRPATRQRAKVAEDLVASLRPGRIIYNPPREMQVAVPVRIQVRIGELAGQDARSQEALERELVAGLERPAVGSQPVSVSKTMKVLLTGAPEEFRIVLQSPEEQWLDTGRATEWRWLVTPLQRGTRRLHLSAVALVNVGGVEKMREFSVYDTDIDVHINYTHLLSEHWGQIASALSATGVTGALAALWKRKRRAAKRRTRTVSASGS